MRLFSKKIYYLIFVIFLFSAAVLTYAQTQLSQDETQNITEQIGAIEQMAAAKLSLSASPSMPTENMKVLVNVSAFRFNEDNADFQWFINGKLSEKESGFGRNEFSFSAGKAGSVNSIKVIAKVMDDDGKKQTLTDELKVKTAGLNLTWTNDTYTPLNYEGKALMTSGSETEFTVLTQIAGSAAQKTFYAWYLDNKKIGSASDYGKQTFSFTSDKQAGTTHRIKVEIMDVFGAKASKTAAIKIVEPEIIIYKYGNSEMIPSYSQTEREYNLQSGQKISLIAVPYFFSIKKPEELNYEWSFNGTRIGGAPENPNIITITAPSGAEKGTYNLKVTARHRNKILQNASFDVKINIK